MKHTSIKCHKPTPPGPTALALCMLAFWDVSACAARTAFGDRGVCLGVYMFEPASPERQEEGGGGGGTMGNLRTGTTSDHSSPLWEAPWLRLLTVAVPFPQLNRSLVRSVSPGAVTFYKRVAQRHCTGCVVEFDFRQMTWGASSSKRSLRCSAN